MIKIKCIQSLLMILLISTSVFAQNTVNVKGTVIDENGQPMIGANVVEKGTTNGTVTDIDGKFNLTVSSEEAILQFSFLGYLLEEVPVNGQTVFNITMVPSFETINEVVAIGYGVVKKSNAVGAISSVNSEDIKNAPVAGLDQALQGKAAGVEVISNSGSPGGSVTMRIRGLSTIGSGKEPLYVIDGMIMGDASFGKEGGNVPDNKMGINFLDPSLVESVEVLKDASATAIYGARGANGVIIITTKKGKKGKANYDLNVYRGFQQLGKKIDVLNGQQFYNFYKEYYENSNLPYEGENRLFPNGDENLANTDWQDQIINNGSIGDLVKSTPIENYTLSVSGGNEDNTYYLSGNYFDQKGLIKNSRFKKYSISFNGTQKLEKKLNIGEKITLVTSDRNRGAELGTIRRDMLAADPSVLPYDTVSDNNLIWTDLTRTSYAGNPVAQEELDYYQYENYRMISSFFLDYEIIPNLKFHSLVGYDLIFGVMEQFEPEYFINSQDKRDDNIFRKRHERWDNFDWESTLNYSKTIGNHDFSVMGGFTFQNEKFVDDRVTHPKFPYDEDFMRYLNVPNPEEINELESSPMEYRIASLLGRLLYSYNEQLLVNATIRRDASSRFGPNYRAGYFPGVSVGYVLSRASFLEKSAWISFLKIRGGIGTLGNQSIPTYRDRTPVIAARHYAFGQAKDVLIGVQPNGVSNPDFRWETTTSENVGIDVGFWKNKLFFNADVFRKTTSDMLLQENPPTYIGLQGMERISTTSSSGPVPIINLAKMRSWGYELQAEYKTLLIGGLNFSVGGNFTYLNNEVLALSENTPKYVSNAGTGIITHELNWTEPGRKINGFYGYVVDGVFQNYDEIADHADQGATDPYTFDRELEPSPNRYTAPGDFKFKDINGDGEITDQDKTYIGDPLPDYTYGAHFSADYRGFGISAAFSGVYGVDVANLSKYFLYGDVASNKALDFYNDHWSLDNPDSKNHRIGLGSNKNQNMRFSTYYIEDASYLRLKNLTISYTLSSSLTQRIGVNTCRIYITGQNILTFTEYSGYDPEIGSSIGFNPNPLDFGVDVVGYPQPRTYTLGINLNF